MDASEPGAVEVLEQAIELLRASPRSLGWYAIGGFPFAAALLYFTAEMASSVYAFDRVPAMSLVLACFFAWKQIWQSVFCASLYEALTGSAVEWTFARRLRMILIQAAIQPLSLVVIPLAFLVQIPFPWAVAFFRNLSLFGAIRENKPVEAARRQALIWNKPHWIMLTILTLFGFLVWANCLIATIVLPMLSNSFFGFESTASRYPMWWLNLPVMSAVGLIAYTLLDPLYDAIYVVRCFLGESRADGLDLAVRLRRLAPQVSAVAMLAIALVAAPSAASGQEQAPPPPVTPAAKSAVNPDELNRKVGEVLRRREFAWRSPEARDARNQSKAASWLDSAFRKFKEFLDWAWKILREIFTDEQTVTANSKGSGMRIAEKWLMVGLVAVVGAVIAVIVFKQRKAAKSKRQTAVQAAVAPPNDVADESVTADKLPEDSWLQMARDLAAKGDFRLALRAQYLATLSMLNGRGLVSIQRWKSGAEYKNEVRRRSYGEPVVPDAFSRNVLLFEMGWYGHHAVTPETLDRFDAGLTEIRNHGQKR